MLDELVYTDSWDLWFKTFFDDAWPVRIGATSSATAALRERRLESGVGRWSEQHLTPYLFNEFLDLIGEDVDLDADTTLAATIRSLPAGQRTPPRYEAGRRAFMLVGGSPSCSPGTGTTRPVGCSSHSRSSEPMRSSEPSTRDRYLSYLEQAFLVFTLPNYSGTDCSGAMSSCGLEDAAAALMDERAQQR
jgi:predicted AAA+ superfamily ATPase